MQEQAESIKPKMQRTLQLGCVLRTDCRWCTVYGYLEHGRYSGSVDDLCEVALVQAKAIGGGEITP